MIDTQQHSEAAPNGSVPPEIQGAPNILSPTGNPGRIVSTGTPALDESHRTFAEFHQGYVSGYIEFADTKAAWAFTIAAALIGYIVNTKEIIGVLLSPVWSMKYATFVLTVFLLVLSAISSFLAIAPRFSRSGEGVVFFSAVAKKRSADAYVREVAAMSDGQLTEARIKHSYDISRVCSQKFWWLRIAFWFGILGLIGMAAVVLLV